jgi:hypothetical protein
MRCPRCGNIVSVTTKQYQCGCLKVPKEILKKEITLEILHKLLTDSKVGPLDGFISTRTGKPFSASLVIKDGGVKFDFGEKESTGTVRIRVHSGSSGTVSVFIRGAVNKSFDTSYGHVSSRMAECLGCITAINIIKHQVPAPKLKLEFSLNNLDFSRYILKERIPRDREIKSALEYLFRTLSEFSGWQAYFKPEKRPKLSGSPQARKFPQGIFPWLDIDISEHDTGLYVKLPDSPDVRAQFLASLQKAVPLEDNTYTLPKAVKSVLMAWVSTVKKAS